MDALQRISRARHHKNVRQLRGPAASRIYPSRHLARRWRHPAAPIAMVADPGKLARHSVQSNKRKSTAQTSGLLSGQSETRRFTGTRGSWTTHCMPGQMRTHPPAIRSDLMTVRSHVVFKRQSCQDAPQPVRRCELLPIRFLVRNTMPSYPASVAARRIRGAPIGLRVPMMILPRQVDFPSKMGPLLEAYKKRGT